MLRFQTAARRQTSAKNQNVSCTFCSLFSICADRNVLSVLASVSVGCLSTQWPRCKSNSQLPENFGLFSICSLHLSANVWLHLSPVSRDFKAPLSLICERLKRGWRALAV